MNRVNITLLILLLLLAMGWGIIYWLFFAENVV
jgi:hypothetical protein